MARVIEILTFPGAGAVLGFLGGFIVGVREGGDMNFAPAIYGPIGAVIGGAIGVIVAAVVAR